MNPEPPQMSLLQSELSLNSHVYFLFFFTQFITTDFWEFTDLLHHYCDFMRLKIMAEVIQF